MRKITQQTVNTFFSGGNLAKNNMVVSGYSVYLHGNNIARKLDNTTIQVCFCEWVTPTTAERINAIVSHATNGKIHVGIKKGNPEFRYQDGTSETISSGDWITVESLYF